jgi:A/G-specific adenine glycosylase
MADATIATAWKFSKMSRVDRNGASVGERLRETPFAERRQGAAQTLIRNAFRRGLGAGAERGVARRRFAAAPLRDPAKRLLPDRYSSDAAPAEMRINSVDQRAAHVLHVQSEARLDAQHQRRGLRGRVGGGLFGPRRPIEAGRLADRREPCADDRLPLRQQRRFAETLFGDKRIERAIDELGEPARLEARVLLHDHGRGYKARAAARRAFRKAPILTLKAKTFDCSLEPPLGRILLDWWDLERRDLPWRAPPGRRADPYAVWLSEIMLQQTTVATVKGYYARFLARWPTVEDLATAPLEDVLAEWAGLGYYARARNLHACAITVARRHGGRFPRGATELLALPGVGAYTAAAIAAIAYDETCVAVDGNVERVISRLYALREPRPALKREVERRAALLLPRARAGDFLQAMMDLGATLCRPRSPVCNRCPWSLACEARRAGRAEDHPIKAAKPAKPHRRGAAFVLLKGDEVLLLRRPGAGLLGAMTAFPTTPLVKDVVPEMQLAHAPLKTRWRRLDGVVRHVFTHFSLELAVFVARGGAGAKGLWTSTATLDEQGLPTLMRKVAVHAGLMDRGSARGKTTFARTSRR